ncbi:hypothetical protein H6503_05025 [Candidatus Woesearchaeota archaeon]|nr:hypothetical protein [Candidatus Woesearchaeota archaeon]
MDLPLPTAFAIAEPWILYGNRLFQPGPSTADDENYMELNDARYKLEEIETPNGLDRIYLAKHEAEIEQFQRDYMQSAINSEFRSRDSINNEINQNKVLSLLITKVLPVITNFSANDQISRIIDEENGIQHQSDFLETMVQRGRQRSSSRQRSQEEEDIAVSETRRQQRSLIQQINQEYSQFEDRQQINERISSLDMTLEDMLTNSAEERFNTLAEQSILATHIFPGRNMMYEGKKFYELVTANDYISYFREFIDRAFYNRLQRHSTKTPPDRLYDLIKENMPLIQKRYLSRLMLKLKTSKIRINEEYFFPILMAEDRYQDIVNRYKKLLEKNIKIMAVEHNEFQTAQMHQIQQQRDILSQIANLDRFELNGSGYEKVNGSYYVFVSTGEFALKSPHRGVAQRYTCFPSAKVGVRVSYGHNRYVIDKPVVMNRYKHPFLSSNDAMQTLCTGRYDLNQSLRLSAEQAIPTLLSKAKEILLMGYREGSNPYSRLEGDHWGPWLTKAEIDRRGVPCLNDFGETTQRTRRY